MPSEGKRFRSRRATSCGLTVRPGSLRAASLILWYQPGSAALTVSANRARSDEVVKEAEATIMMRGKK